MNRRTDKWRERGTLSLIELLIAAKNYTYHNIFKTSYELEVLLNWSNVLHVHVAIYLQYIDI